MPNEATRAYIYRVLTATGPLLTAFGLVSEQTWPLIVALVATVLGTGLASANTSTKS